MSCKYAIFNDEGRYDCKISDDECIYLIPNRYLEGLEDERKTI